MTEEKLIAHIWQDFTRGLVNKLALANKWKVDVGYINQVLELKKEELSEKARLTGRDLELIKPYWQRIYELGGFFEVNQTEEDKTWIKKQQKVCLDQIKQINYGFWEILSPIDDDSSN